MINDKLLTEIKQYCKLNDIEDVDALINKMLKQGFTIEKHGAIPEIAKPKEKKVKEEKPKANKYLIKIKIEEEQVIEETIKVKPEIKEDTEKDIYGE